MNKNVITTDKLLSWIIGLMTLIATMVGWIYVDNKKAQERQNERLEAMILKIDGKFTEHCEKAEMRISELEYDVYNDIQKPKRKMQRTNRTLIDINE